MKLNTENTVKTEPPLLKVQKHTVILLLLLFWGLLCMFSKNLISAWDNKNVFNMHKFLYCVMFVSCCLTHNRSRY